MSHSSSLHWLLVSSLLFAACGDGSDPEASSEMESDPSETASAGRDAGAKDGGGRLTSRDASSRRADASMDSTSGDPTSGDPTTGELPVVDAGRHVASADAGKSDAGKSDAGRANAGTPDAGGAGNVCDTLTYAAFGQAFMSKYCVSCHGAFLPQKNVKLDSLMGVQASKSKVKTEVANKSMPPGGSAAPTTVERQQLGQWIDCGPK